MLFQLLYIPGFVNLACRLLPPSLQVSQPNSPKLTLSHIFLLSPSPFLGPLPTLLSMSEPSNGTNQRAESGRVRRPSEKVLHLGESFLCRLQLFSQTHTLIAEARREKENSRYNAAQRSKQRSEKKAVFQRKVAERELASRGGKNKKNGNLIMSYYSAFHPALNSAHCCLTTSTESYDSYP